MTRRATTTAALVMMRLPDDAPAQVGDFKLLSVVGRGGMGVVYEAADARNGQRAAVKVIDKIHEVSLHRLRHEVEALRRLRHPGVVSFLEEGVYQQRMPWFAMTLLEGQTLQWYIREHRKRAQQRPPTLAGGIPSGVRRMLGWLGQLAQTLGWLHGEGYVHCDLKPENIVLHKGDNPVLVDFGVVARFGARVAPKSLETSGLMAGTADYISPEQIRGGLVDARADLYALGCILYEVLTGRPPFAGVEAARLLDLHLEATPAPPSQREPWVPAALDELVAALLQKQPEDRPGHANAVLAVLRALQIEDIERPGAPAPRPYLYKPSLVGRDKLMKALRGSLRQATQGEGAAVLLGGEAGSGKSRVALELLRYARSRRIVALNGQSEDLASAGGVISAPLQTFAPVLQTIAYRCLEVGVEGTERLLGDRGPILAPYAPFLKQLPGQEVLPPPPALSPEASQRRVFKALLETISALAEDQPLLLVFDDLQWADELSLISVRALARWIQSAQKPWMLLGLYRDPIPDPAPALENLKRCESLRNITLERLGEADILSILRDMLGLARPHADLAGFVALHARGNPLNAAESLRAVVEQGLLRRDEAGEWRLSEESGRLRQSLSGLMSTPALQEAALRNLDSLSGAAQELAQALSVLGRAVELDQLAELARVDDLEKALVELEQRELLERADDQRVSFRHARLREGVYQRLPERRRAALHGRVAVLLASLSEAGQAVDEARLASHWERSGQAALASRAYLRAGRRAADTGATHDARRLYGRALSLLPEGSAEAAEARLDFIQRVLLPEDDQEEALRLLGEGAMSPREALLRGQLALQRWQLAEALGALQRAGSEPLALALLGAAQVARGFLARGQETLQRLLEAPGELNQSAQIRATLDLSMALLRQGLHAESTNRHRQALRMARTAGERRQEGRALRRLAHLHHLQGRQALAQEMLQESFLIATDQLDTEGMALASLEAGLQARRRGQHNTAREEVQALLQRPPRATTPALRAAALALQGDLELDRGHLGDAAQRFDEAGALLQQTGQVFEAQELRLRQARLALLRRDFAQALAALEPALLYARTQHAAPLEAELSTALAQVSLAQGDLEGAADALRGALEGASRSLRADLEAAALVTSARLERLRNDLPRAEAQLQQARALIKEMGDLSQLSLALIEEGHQRLFRGELPQETLMDLLRLADALACTPESATGQGLAALQRAVASHRAQRPLRFGADLSDLPSPTSP